MQILRILVLIVAGLGLAACGKKEDSKFLSYKGPEVTSIQVHKSARRMYLLNDRKVLQAYDIGLGFQPEGHKQFEGDGKTPEGVYYISHRNPNSQYHLSLGVSYPNPVDREFASTQGKSAGGDIMIHGGPRQKVTKADWTAGCIAVSDKEIEHIYSMVNPGTPIYILP